MKRPPTTIGSHQGLWRAFRCSRRQRHVTAPVACLAALLVACHATPQETSRPADTGDTGDTGLPPVTGCEADEAALRALIPMASPTSSAVGAVLAGVDQRCGWPIQAGSGSFLFAAICSSDGWAVAGDFDGWEGQAFVRNGALCWAEIEIPSPTDAGYKFTDGSAWEADPWARRLAYDEYGELSLVRAERAHLERWQGFSAEGLRARTVRVWVPEGGAFDRALYAHDGQNLFDPAGPWGGWHLQDALPAGVLVVANDNTSDRMEEYTHVEDLLHGEWYGGWGETYGAFVQERLRPWADAQYGPADRYGLMGSSLGGLISLAIADQYPGAWDYAASLSGTLGWGSIGAHNETLIERYSAAGHRDTAIYLDSGGYGTTCADADGDGIDDDDPDSADNYCETIQMRDTLAAEGYAFEEDLWHWWEPDAAHDEAAWAARVDLPLSIFASLE
jgi:predicted alpha/beta superfamily hydrolase